MRHNPSPARDALLRSYAEGAFEKLLAWARRLLPTSEWRFETLYVDRGGQLFPLRVIPWWKVDASIPLKHPLRGVKILVGGRSPDDALGSLTDDPNHGLLLTLWNVLATPTGFSGFASRLLGVREVFVHEYVHLLDRLRIEPEAWRRMSRGRRTAAGERRGADYFLSPQEFNAYFQEGFHRFAASFRSLLAQRPALESGGVRLTPDQLVASIRRTPKRLEEVWEKLAIDAEGWLAWDNVRWKLEDWWHNGFLEFVRKDPVMKQRFLKRLRVNFEAWRAEQLAWLNPLWQVVKDADQGVVATNPGGNEYLAYLLAPRGKVSQIGPERGASPRDGTAVWRSPHGSCRYVFIRGGRVVAAIQVMTRDGKHGLVANAFTSPEARRQGLGRVLVQRAKADFQRITFGDDRSDDGKGFVVAVRENPDDVRERVLAWIDSFGDPITLYREIVVPRGGAVDSRDVGRYWTPVREKAVAPHGRADHPTGDRVLLTAKVRRSDVDEFETVATMRRYPAEQEIRLKRGSCVSLENPRSIDPEADHPHHFTRGWARVAAERRLARMRSKRTALDGLDPTIRGLELQSIRDPRWTFIISPSVQGGGRWQVSDFHDGEPTGHFFAKTPKEAIEELVRDWGELRRLAARNPRAPLLPPNEHPREKGWGNDVGRRAGYVTVFHGTRDFLVPEIKAKGLQSPKQSGPQWFMVAADFASAAHHANANGYAQGEPVVLEYRVPTHEKKRAGHVHVPWEGWPYLWKPHPIDWSGTPSRWWALRATLPKRFLVAVHAVPTEQRRENPRRRNQPPETPVVVGRLSRDEAQALWLDLYMRGKHAGERPPVVKIPGYERAERYVDVWLPLEWLAPDWRSLPDEGNFVPHISGEKIKRAASYAARAGDLPPGAALLGERAVRKGAVQATLFDGNHRALAALMRGLSHARVLIPEADYVRLLVVRGV